MFKTFVGPSYTFLYSSVTVSQYLVKIHICKLFQCQFHHVFTAIMCPAIFWNLFATLVILLVVRYCHASCLKSETLLYQSFLIPFLLVYSCHRGNCDDIYWLPVKSHCDICYFLESNFIKRKISVNGGFCDLNPCSMLVILNTGVEHVDSRQLCRDAGVTQ